MPGPEYPKGVVKQPVEDFFFTAADLHGLYEIIPCKTGPKYIGILLVYSDGHREAVGKVRLDRLASPMRPGPGPVWRRIRVGSWISSVRGRGFIQPVQLGVEDMSSSLFPAVRGSSGGGGLGVRAQVFYENQHSPVIGRHGPSVPGLKCSAA